MAEIDEFVNLLQKHAAREQGEIAQKLVNHGVADWDEYNRMTGQAKGIGRLADIAYQLMKQRDLDPDGGLSGMPDEPPDKTPASKKRARS